MKLFPSITITQTELNVAAECLSNPAVHKYIQSQIYAGAAGIAMGIPDQGESAEEYLRRCAEMRGQMMFAEALLNIEPVRADTNSGRDAA